VPFLQNGQSQFYVFEFKVFLENLLPDGLKEEK
jgi:hypothetical protein